MENSLKVEKSCNDGTAIQYKEKSLEKNDFNTKYVFRRKQCRGGCRRTEA